jgi:hypothetical protein
MVRLVFGLRIQVFDRSRNKAEATSPLGLLALLACRADPLLSLDKAVGWVERSAPHRFAGNSWGTGFARSPYSENRSALG